MNDELCLDPILEVPLPCSRDRKGVWTLWWRFEALRSLNEDFESHDPRSNLEEPLSARVVERQVTTEEMKHIQTLLERHGLILS